MIRHKTVEIRAKAFEDKGVQKHEVSVVESVVDNPNWDGRRRSQQKMLKVTVGVRDPKTGDYTYNHDLCPAAIRRAVKLAMPWRVHIEPEGVIKRRFFAERDAQAYASRFGEAGSWYKEGGRNDKDE